MSNDERLTHGSVTEQNHYFLYSRSQHFEAFESRQICCRSHQAEFSVARTVWSSVLSWPTLRLLTLSRWSRLCWNMEHSQDTNLQEVWSLLEEFRQFDHAGVDLYREVILTEEAKEPHNGLCLLSSLDWSDCCISHISNPTYHSLVKPSLEGRGRQTWLEFVTLWSEPGGSWPTLSCT